MKKGSLSSSHSTSDTAFWAAAFRALENERSEALFRDPFAARLAGRRGMEMLATLSQDAHTSSWAVRTYLFDQIIAQAVNQGVELVINLGAGLDARPYRMDLPASLAWLEVDLPEILDYKQQVLGPEKARCALQRIGLDLRNVRVRRTLFEQIHRLGTNVLIVTEGLLIYLAPEEVGLLAGDMLAARAGQRWVTEIASPAVVDNMRGTAEAAMQDGVRFQFGPAEGPQFLRNYGWELCAVQSILRTAVQLGRTPFDPKLASLLPDSWPSANPEAWLGVCLFEQAPPAELGASFTTRCALPPDRSDSQYPVWCESEDAQIRNQSSYANS
jgi:methyltransferase (TIGR00027 family)